MTLKRRVIPLSLLFAGIFASMVVLTSTARADSKHVTIHEPVTIGNVVLKPGEYTVVWSGSGPEVQVSFMRGSKTVATATARLVLEKNPNGRSLFTETMPDNSTALKRISFSRKSLIFDQSGLGETPTARID